MGVECVRRRRKKKTAREKKKTVGRGNEEDGRKRLGRKES